MKNINAIVAVDAAWGIGKDNDMPWPKLTSDLKRFKELTNNSVVVMGKNTWLSLPKKPLPNRENIVISKSLDDDYAIKLSGNPETIINTIKNKTDKDIWIMGGKQIYEQFLDYCNKIYVTKIKGDFNCDIIFPKLQLLNSFKIESKSEVFLDNNIEIYYETWEKK